MGRKQFPDQSDWLSFFETRPVEGFERDMPIEYQDLTFRFENQEVRFVVTMLLGFKSFL